MRRKISEVSIISWGLAILYISSFFIYLQSFRILGFQFHAFVLTILFGGLSAASLGAAQFKALGRKSMLALAVVSGIYLTGLYLRHPDFIPVSYIFLSIIVFLFYSQARVKTKFLDSLSGKWQSVLVIDDDETLIRTVRPILISNGFAVLSANSGEDGIQIARNQRPDLIILDVILPGMKGREVCRRLKGDRLTKGIPVIFLTAKFSQDDVAAEKAVGAVAHLTKPVNPTELVATVKKVFAQR